MRSKCKRGNGRPENGHEFAPLILLDLSMPIMTGSEFLTEVAKNPAWVDIPICITTGVAELPKFDRTVDILRKPISFQELMKQIHKSCHPSVSSAEEDVA